MKKFISVLIASILISYTTLAQSSGDYRSIGSGNWNDPTKWETYNGSSWVAAPTYPGQNPGTGAVTIMNQTEIIITATVPNPISYLDVNAYYACYCEYDNYGQHVQFGILTFSSESAISLTITGGATIYGELLIDDRNGAKSHSIFIGGSLLFGDAWWDYEYYQHPTVFQTINQDDKLNVTFNTSVPNSIVAGYLSSFLDLSFQDVTFNGIGISFQIGVLVNGHANFVNGKVGAAITFEDGATYSGASDASYVEGSVAKQGDDAFTFPIGSNGIYAPLTISAPIGQTETFIVGYGRGDAEELGIIKDPGLFSVSNCEYWNLQPGSNNSNNYSLDVTVGWNTASGCGSSPYINNVADVTLARFNNTNNSWSNHGGSGIGTTTNGSVTSTGVNTFGYFTLGNLGSCAAPFELNTINITANSATVNWSALTSSVSYSVEYVEGIATSLSNWINVASATTSKSVNITGLSPRTSYYWRVRSNCTSASSKYRYSIFTTPVACGDPTGLSIANITTSSATLTWGAVTNALNYDVEYKQPDSYTWIPAVTGTTSLSYNLSGLVTFTTYEWRVHANCSAGAGNFIQSSFTTSLPDCNSMYEPNNSSGEAKTIGFGTTIFAGITSPNDVDWFKVTTLNNSNTSLGVQIFSLPADYDLYVYNKNLKLIGSSVNSGTSYELVYYNSNTRNATYYIKVIGKDGAYDPGCYSLLAQVFSGGNRPVSHASVPVNEVTEDLYKQFLYPNPASAFVYLNFNSATEGLVNIQIVNSIGQLVKQHPVNTIKGHNQFKIQVADIRPGMYILRINKGDLNLTKKFVIAR